MSDKHQDPKGAVTAIFNSAVAATAISAAWDIGLFGKLETEGRVCLTEFVEQHDLDDVAVRGLANALAVVDVVDRENDTVVPGKLFEEANRTKSLFYWLTAGSGELFTRAPFIFARSERKGDFYRRDAKAIAYACDEINRVFVDPVFKQVIDGLDLEHLQVIADLGCGSGERLMQILDRHAHTTGIGIDIAQPAIDFARERATQRDLAHRLSFITGNVNELTHRDDYLRVDLLTCFFTGHDFWPRENCIATLKQLRRSFPNARRLILGDVTRVLDSSETRDAVSVKEAPIFSLGFEFGHALMGVHIPTLSDWEGVFGAGGWRCANQHIVEPPSRTVIFELVPEKE